MPRYYYYKFIDKFLIDSNLAILGELTDNAGNVESALKNSWQTQIILLKTKLREVDGSLVFEYSIPRLGKRIDCVILSGGIVFAIEFKVGAHGFDAYAIDQVTDYALDLKYFHEQSHEAMIVPILVCTNAPKKPFMIDFFNDGVAKTVLSNGANLTNLLSEFSAQNIEQENNPDAWVNSRYSPTPTIIEAAQALYNGNSVEEITRSEAGKINLSITTSAILDIIDSSRKKRQKAICFITGVPGSGKTLAGLNLAHKLHNEETGEQAVFLSGNGPLVKVLREALIRDRVRVTRENNNPISRSDVEHEVQAFIQNIHHFRDYAMDYPGPIHERVVIFDEAQRAWNLRQLNSFMKSKKGIPDFNKSEPEFLIEVLDRHEDWATIICLVGGGQEINTGEAGLHEWFNALRKHFPNWEIYVSNDLTDEEYTQGHSLFEGIESRRIHFDKNLHLSVSARSFRSEKVSALIKAILDCNNNEAKKLNSDIQSTYPIFITRDLDLAKQWLKSKARGSERYGIVASSGGIRLKSCGINVKAEIDPKMWFLNGKNDVRSSFYLEDVATEFDIQGLELDWICVAWDADLRYNSESWDLKAFRGTKWQNVKNDDAKLYLKNTYRVLLTRARQGMVIFVPYGSTDDETRKPDFYDKTYHYLHSLGIPEL